MRSLKARLQLALGVCLLGFALLLWFAGSRLLETLATDLIATQLVDDTEALLATIDFDASGAPQLSSVDPIFQQPFSGHYYALLIGDTVLTSRSLWDGELTVSSLPPGRVELRHRTGPQQQRLLVRTGGYRKGAQRFTLAVAADLAPVDSHRRRLGLAVVASAVGAALVFGLTQHAVLRVSFRPLARIRDGVAALEAGTTERLSEDVPQEVLPLVREVNRLLQTLTRRLGRSRHALGDLAHALKTPLQILALDLARDPVTPGAAAARAQAEQIAALVERELKRARLAGDSAPAERFALPGDLEDLCATVRQLYRDRALEIDFVVTGVVQPFGDREDLQELLGNLLDNACKWARRRVLVRVAAGDRIEIIVSDDGPGIQGAAIAVALARGARLDESRSGYGFGLAIVGDIVAAYQGQIDFRRDAELGGLAVVVSLPWEPDPAAT